MCAIKKKIESRRGASITFALLLFLVCAMVSAVAIVAATTSAGRMSQLAQMDQRYYAVNSAAELLCDIFVGSDSEPTPAVTVTYTKADGEAQSTDYTIDEATRSLDVSLVVKAAEAAAKARVTKDEVVLASDTDPKVLQAKVDGVSLNCNITEKMKPDGLLVFNISNAVSNADTSKGKYQLELTLASDLKKANSGSGATTDKLTVLGWKLHSIKKIRADESAE